MFTLKDVDNLIHDRRSRLPSDIEEPVYEDIFKQALNRWLRAAEDASLHKDPLRAYHEILEPWLSTLVGASATHPFGRALGNRGYEKLEHFFYENLGLACSMQQKAMQLRS